MPLILGEAAAGGGGDEVEGSGASGVAHRAAVLLKLRRDRTAGWLLLLLGSLKHRQRTTRDIWLEIGRLRLTTRGNCSSWSG